MHPTYRALSRRTLLAFAAAVAVVPIAGTAAEAKGTHKPPPFATSTVALPDGLRPEGITSGPGSRFYVGSLADGRIVTGDLFRTGTSVLLAGATGRQIRGLFYDRRSSLLWAVGNVGTVAHVWAVNSRRGTVVSDTVIAGGIFLNDLVVTKSAVWVTDSKVDRLAVIGLTRSGWPAKKPARFVALGGAWPKGDGVAINANGIRTLPDDSIVLNNSRVGGLWQVDPRSGTTREITVTGGPGITGGDGLEISGDTLFNVRGSGQKEVSVLRLKAARHGKDCHQKHCDGRHCHGNGRQLCTTWWARWVTALTDASLDVPSTATLAAGSLWAVNARFGVASPETATYAITRLALRR